jgi:hypothetical protein
VTERVPSPHDTITPDEGETTHAWTDRLVRAGAALGVRRQCSIGYHRECSARADGPNAECRCTCHGQEPVPPLWAGRDLHDGDGPPMLVDYGDSLVIENEQVSLLDLDREEAAALGAALTAWAGEQS